jgi:hypothetical protein
MVVAKTRGPFRAQAPQAFANGRPHRKLHRMALAVVEADSLDACEALERPGETDGGILPAGEQH